MKFISYGTNFLTNIKYEVENHSFLNKPSNASCLWATPADEEKYYTWKQFCIDNDFGVDKLDKYIIFELNDDVRIFNIDTEKAVKYLDINYGKTSKHFGKVFDWKEISKNYDAIFFNYSALGFDLIDNDLFDKYNLITFDCDTLMIFNTKVIKNVNNR